MSERSARPINVVKSMVVGDGGSKNVVVGCISLGMAAIGVVVVVAVCSGCTKLLLGVGATGLVLLRFLLDGDMLNRKNAPVIDGV
jgi:hypothetical protein